MDWREVESDGVVAKLPQSNTKRILTKPQRYRHETSKHNDSAKGLMLESDILESDGSKSQSCGTCESSLYSQLPHLVNQLMNGLVVSSCVD